MKPDVSSPPAPGGESFIVWPCRTRNPSDDPHHPAFQMKMATPFAQLTFPGPGWALCQWEGLQFQTVLRAP